jgi:hypothetical protein
MRHLEVYRSLDGRYRTSAYVRDGTSLFCLSEPTRHGVLVTEFCGNGEVANQIHTKGGSPYDALSAFIGNDFELGVKDIGIYRPVEVRARCGSCGNAKIGRELDAKTANEIDQVPVVPLFLCRSCGKRFYSINDRYLRRLVEGNLSLFEESELEEMRKDCDAFIYTMKEYIVRIFASKKIGKLAIEQ